MPKKINITLLASDYLNILGYSLFFPFFALFAVSIGATPQTTGFIWALNTVVAGTVVLTYGALSLKIKHERVVVLLSLILLSITSLIFLQVKDVHQLFIAIIFNAVASGLYVPSWKSVYTRSMKKKDSTRDWSWFDGGNMLVTSGGAAIGGVLIGVYGFHGALMTMFSLQVLGAIMATRLFISPRK
jgi:MFS family permease